MINCLQLSDHLGPTTTTTEANSLAEGTMAIFIKALMISIFKTVFAKLSIAAVLIIFFTVAEHDVFLSH